MMDFASVITTPYVFVVALIALLSLLYLMVYYGLVFFRMGRTKASTTDDDSGRLPGVSVVLTAHNDADWLRENLVYLLEQDYPNFEVVVVDYVSQDDTQFVLQLCAENYPNLKVVSFREDVNMFKGKKYPLSIGIKSAKNDILLFADADCVPKDFNWIREMVKGYSSKNRQIVLGFSGVRQEKSLLNWLQVYDNLVYNLSFLSAAQLGRPYTGCGRNLSYRRSFFFGSGAFISHYSIPYGADDMFVNQNATKDNTSVVLVDKSFVLSDAQKDFRRWHQLRRGRFATRKYYRSSLKFSLAAYPLSLILFYLSLFFLLFVNGFLWQIVVGLFVVKTAWQMISLYFSCKLFDVKYLCWLSPLFEIYFLIANTFLYFVSLLDKK